MPRTAVCGLQKIGFRLKLCGVGLKQLVAANYCLPLDNDVIELFILLNRGVVRIGVRV